MTTDPEPFYHLDRECSDKYIKDGRCTACGATKKDRPAKKDEPSDDELKRELDRINGYLARLEADVERIPIKLAFRMRVPSHNAVFSYEKADTSYWRLRMDGIPLDQCSAERKLLAAEWGGAFFSRYLDYQKQFLERARKAGKGEPQ